MNKGEDFIPHKDAEYTVFFSNLERYVDTKTHGPDPRWIHIPQADLAGLTGTLNDWKNAYTPTLTPHTPETTHEKNRVRKSSEKYLRHFINQFLRYSDAVTDYDRDQMGIPNPDPVKTRVETPKSSPVFSIEIAGPGRLNIRLHPEETERMAIPYGYGGAVICWQISEEPINDPKRLTESELATTSIHTLYFGEPDWGKKVYICLRWQTKGGGRKGARQGPPSPIQASVIP
jgi:hypothetical protein